MKRFLTTASSYVKATKLNRLTAISCLCLALVFVPIAEAKTINIGGVTLNITSNVSDVPRQDLIDQALASGRILSLIKIIRKVEGTYGGSVLDAGLFSPRPKNTATWYYYIKHRSNAGRVSARYFSASTGKELK